MLVARFHSFTKNPDSVVRSKPLSRRASRGGGPGICLETECLPSASMLCLVWGTRACCGFCVVAWIAGIEFGAVCFGFYWSCSLFMFPIKGGMTFSCTNAMVLLPQATVASFLLLKLIVFQPRGGIDAPRSKDWLTTFCWICT